MAPERHLAPHSSSAGGVLPATRRALRSQPPGRKGDLRAQVPSPLEGARQGGLPGSGGGLGGRCRGAHGRSWGGWVACEAGQVWGRIS